MKPIGTRNSRRGFSGDVNSVNATVDRTVFNSSRRPKSFTFFLVLVIAGVLLTSFLYSVLVSPGGQDGIPAKTEYSSRGPIKIVGDVGFIAANGVVSGNGTSGDPYIIYDWEIDASGGIAIDISGTRAYFVIISCFLKNGSANGWDGILLSDVENGTIIYNLITGNAHGIHVQSSDHNIVIENNVSNNGLDGIYLDNSFNNSILNNSCWLNAWNGIFLSISDDNIVNYNICNKNNWTGIYLEASSDNFIIWNNCSRNLDDGIGAYWNCNGNIIYQNVVILNVDYGCSISTSCAGNTIYENTFIFNNGALAYPLYNPLTVQGYDNNPMANSWSNGINGNYWADWTGPDSESNGIVDSPYLLDPGGNVDPLPLTNWIIIPEPGILMLSIIIIAVCLLQMRMRKRQDS